MKKPVIFCIDDEKMILTSLKEQLKRHFGKEYDIETVDNGEETLEIIESLEKDNIDIPVVLCDQIMPGIKGDVLLQKIHTRLPKTLKILLTGQADAIAIGNAVNYANLYRYIAKPWEQMDLILTVSEATRSYFQDKQLEEQNAILQQINQELERFNATLECQVKERTAELEAQKIELQQKNAQLHELNASKDKFFSIISHDLRSPFQALLGYSQLLEETLETASKDEIISDIKRLQKTVEQLYALLENLLTWSTIQRGIIKYHLQELELDKVVESNLDLFTPKAEQKQITLKNSITKGLIVYADSNMLNTILRNLISNALKFTPTGGIVEILTRSHYETDIEITVSDSGVGIKPEDISKLFHIDMQYTNTGTDGEQGTGLGLNLCKDLVEKNGGTIWLESEVGKGTNFKFTLPKVIRNSVVFLKQC
ncbi:MAG: response regulator [Thioploca sp.]|nr:response regulator [Thioploca sp.]